MSKIFYLTSNAYQVSNGFPLYRQLGGTFLVKSFKRWVQFKKYLQGGNCHSKIHTFLNTPLVKRVDVRKPLDFEGIFIFLANMSVRCSHPNAKTVFIGHGTGDKPYQGKNAGERLEAIDFHFISGPKHMEKLRDTHVALAENRLIKIGNMRFDDYINGKIDKERMLRTVGINDRSRKTVLYAPTWEWGKGTLLKYGKKFCRELSKQFNVIIRPHAHDRMHIRKMRRWANNEGLQHVYFSNPSDIIRHDTIDVFLISDILLSDTSAVLYEYLVTEKPIIVIKSDYDELHNMPAEVDINTIANHYDGSQDIETLVMRTIEDHYKHKESYIRMLHHTFYFNDGKSTNRAVEFITSLQS